jgi:uncharacterized repeat protein (TIGR01451 family)
MRSHSPVKALGPIGALLLVSALLGTTGAAAQGVIPVGDLPPGESVTVTFDAVIRNDGLPFPIPFGTTFVVNQGQVNGTNFVSLLTDDPDDPTSDMDPTETPLDLANLGNVVWQDNGDGVFDGGILDVAIDGVLVNLFTDDGSAPGVLDATDTLRASGPTSGGGVYSFIGLTPGEYIVQIDASNFAAGMPLENFFSVPGATDPDDDINNDDNGVDMFDFSGGISSLAITLITDTEPDTPMDGDDIDGNLTLDFGFTEEVDIALSKTESIDPVVAGSGAGNLVYVVTATNNGPANASGVVIGEAVTLPAGVTIDSIVPSAGTYLPANDPNGTWTLGALANGASETLTVTLTANSAAVSGTDTISDTATLTAVDQNDTDSGNDSITESTSVTREVDMRIEKNGVPEPEVVAGSGVGANVTYTVLAINDGPSDATNIVVQDDLGLPAVGVNLVTATPSQGAFDSGTGEWLVGDLVSGTQASLVIEVRAESSARDGARITNTASLTSVDETETGPGQNSDNVDTDIIREIDILVEKAGVPDPDVVAGSNAGVQNLTHTVTVTNNGPSDSTNVELSDVTTLPANVTIDSITPSQGSFTSPTWAVGDLVSGASATLTIVYNVTSAAADGDTVNNVATFVASDETETGGGANSATVDTNIVREVDIVLAKVGVPDPDVVAGANGGVQNLTHTLTVTNDGPSDSTSIEVEDLITLPASVTIDSITPSQGSFAGTTWTLGDLVSGSSATLTIVYNVASSAVAGTIVQNDGSLGSVDETETDASDNTASVVTTIVRVVDLTLTKTESVDPALAGAGAGNLVYVVTVQSNGPSDLTSLTIDEVVTFPAGVTLDTVVVSAGAYAPPDDPNGVWTLSLVSGASATLTATLTVDETAATGTDVISDTATVTGSGGAETLTGDTSVTESTSVLADFDLGDAPDPVEVTGGEYPTLRANDGARHLLVPGDVFLGTAVDFEADGQPTIDADGDDLAGVDDEDGVTFSSGVQAGASTDLEVFASAAGVLNVWVDFEVDGDWTGTGEHVFVDEPLTAGLNSLSFVSPVTAFDSDLADLLEGTFVRFRFDTGGGLAPTGLAIGGEVEDHFVEISKETDLEVSLAELVDPVVAGDVQMFSLTVTNNGPAQATDVVLQQELPRGGIFLGAEPTSIDCAVLSGLLVDCALGAMQPGDSLDVVIGALMDHRVDALQSSEAIVAGNEPDPDGSNDDAMVDFEVVGNREMVATFRGNKKTLAMIAKEGDNSVSMVFANAKGGDDREYSVEGIGYRATALTEVENFGGTSSPEVAALAAGFDGTTKVLIVDANDQTLLGDYDIPGGWYAIDIASVDSFDDTTAPEVAILLRDTIDTEVRVQVLDAMSGVVVRDHLVATSTPNPPGEDIAAPFPIGFDLVDDFGGSLSPELVIGLKNPDTEEVSVLVIDPDSGAELGNHSQGDDLFPLGIVGLEDLGLGGGTSAPDAALLVRRASDLDLFAIVLDASSGATFGPVDFDDMLRPGSFTRVPDAGSSTASELAVTGREDPDTLTVSIRDAATSAVVNSIAISSPPLVPVPLGQVHHEDFGGGPDAELAILFEYFEAPTQVQIFDVLGAAPLFTFFLP